MFILDTTHPNDQFKFLNCITCIYHLKKNCMHINLFIVLLFAKYYAGSCLRSLVALCEITYTGLNFKLDEAANSVIAYSHIERKT